MLVHPRRSKVRLLWLELCQPLLLFMRKNGLPFTWYVPFEVDEYAADSSNPNSP